MTSLPNIRPEVERFLRRLGYRLVMNELKHPSTARPGEKIQLAMKWQNVGSAPCYKPYRVAYRLSIERYEKVFVGEATVNNWLPGSMCVVRGCPEEACEEAGQEGGRPKGEEEGAVVGD